jgi:hypothetical protein
VAETSIYVYQVIRRHIADDSRRYSSYSRDIIIPVIQIETIEIPISSFVSVPMKGIFLRITTLCKLNAFTTTPCVLLLNTRLFRRFTKASLVISNNSHFASLR